MTEEVLEEGKEVKRQIKIDPKELIMKIVFIIAAAVFIAAVITICVFIFVQAFPALKEIGLFSFLFGDESSAASISRVAHSSSAFPSVFSRRSLWRATALSLFTKL